MSFCQERLHKLNERVKLPLPPYKETQITRTRVIRHESTDAPQLSAIASISESLALKTELKIGNPDKRPAQTAESQLVSAAFWTESDIGHRPTTDSPQSSNSKGSPGTAKLTDPQVINTNPKMRSENPIEPGINQQQPSGGALMRKDSLGERVALEVPKRIKESTNQDSNSDFLLINSGLEQKNKITSYFKSTPSGDPNTKKPYDNLTSFSQASHLIKAEPKPADNQLPSKWELLLKEKEKELDIFKKMLKTKDEQLTDFKNRAKQVVSGMSVELEEYRRSERRRFIDAEKWRVGEFVTYRDGAQLKEKWENGYEIRELKERLQEITEQKEQIENMKKKLKKRTGKQPLTEEKNSCFPSNSNAVTDRQSNLNQGYQNENGGYGLGLTRNASFCRNELKFTGSIYKNPANTTELSDSSNNYSAMNEKTIEENRERLNSRLLILTREENYYKEKIDVIERQKDNYIKLSKQLFEEENCRYGKTNPNADTRWPLLKNRYQILSLMGKGGFSEVYKAYDLEELKLVACKIHQLSQSWSENFKSNYIKHALRENQVHKNLQHPNIVSHLDSVEIDSNSFCAVLEFCNGPDLASYLRKHKTIPEKDAKSIAKQILSGLKFLNETSKKIIHYDLKPQNILFHDGLIKISDFGLCKVMDEGQTRLELTSQGVGTYWYLPPECFHNNYPKISTKVDVWSVGVILYELLYGIKPFGNDMCQEKILKEGIMLRAYTLDFPSKPSVSSELKDVIKRCLEYNQEERPEVIDVWNMLSKL